MASEAQSERAGSRQPRPFDPARAGQLDDPARLAYLPPLDLLRLLDPPAGTAVLDFGAGTGTYAIALARFRPDLRIIAMDEQPQMLAHLKRKLAAADAPGNVFPMLPAELESGGESFPRVLALNVLHELGDAVLRDLPRRLAPEGRILFVDWNAAAERPVGPPSEHVYRPGEALMRLRHLGYHAVLAGEFAYHYAVIASWTEPASGLLAAGSA